MQVAAYNHKSEAEALVSTLKKRGYDARVDGSVAPFRVRIGRYTTEKNAEDELKRLKAKTHGRIRSESTGTVSRTASAPLMQQYREIKSRHQDAILFFRMGDFYEMFYEDAERLRRRPSASRSLPGITAARARFPWPAFR